MITNIIALGYIFKQLYAISKKSTIKDRIRRCARRIRRICIKPTKNKSEISIQGLDTGLIISSKDAYSHTLAESVQESQEE